MQPDYTVKIVTDNADAEVSVVGNQVIEATPADVGKVVTVAADGSLVLAEGGGGGVTDHGALTGLADDDHSAYSLTSHAHSGTYVPLSVVDAADDLIVGSGADAVTRLAVAASRIIGKKASGGLDDLTAAEALTVLGLSGVPLPLAKAFATAGATASPNANYASFNTPWSVQVTTPVAGDVYIDVTGVVSFAANNILFVAVYRDGSIVANSGEVFHSAGTRPQSFGFRWVDASLAAGTYTYEVRVGCDGSASATIQNATSTTPSITPGTNKGQSVMVISACRA